MNPRRTSRPGVMINRMRAQSLLAPVEAAPAPVAPQVPTSMPVPMPTLSARRSLFFLPAR